MQSSRLIFLLLILLTGLARGAEPGQSACDKLAPKDAVECRARTSQQAKVSRAAVEPPASQQSGASDAPIARLRAVITQGVAVYLVENGKICKQWRFRRVEQGGNRAVLSLQNGMDAVHDDAQLQLTADGVTVESQRKESENGHYSVADMADGFRFADQGLVRKIFLTEAACLVDAAAHRRYESDEYATGVLTPGRRDLPQ